MQTSAEYLEKALNFEQLAGLESDPKMKASLLQQAEAYRKLAAALTARKKKPRAVDGPAFDGVRLGVGYLSSFRNDFRLRVTQSPSQRRATRSHTQRAPVT